MSLQLRNTSWQPLADQDLTLRINGLLTSILRRFPTDRYGIEALTGRGGRSQYNLAYGYAGIAVLFDYFAVVYDSDAYQEIALNYLNTAIEFQSRENRDWYDGLHGGVTGIAWAAEHLQKKLSLEQAEDINSDVDETLTKIYGQTRRPVLEFDLMGGLTGLSLYALARKSRPSSQALLRVILRKLRDRATISESGVTWHTTPEQLAAKNRVLFPLGYHNLGLAHGVPGVIALLAKVHGNSECSDESEHVLYEAVRWILQQEQPEHSCSRFSGMLERPDPNSRLAWCYGDGGVAVALLSAARSCHCLEWEEHALRIARCAALRTKENSGVIDACICHGSAGVAHIFNRLFQATRQRVFKEAALYWINVTLDLLSSQPPGRFQFYSFEDGRAEFVEKLGMLDGIAGVALCLLAAVSNVEPQWDSVFLLDIPCVD